MKNKLYNILLIFVILTFVFSGCEKKKNPSSEEENPNIKDWTLLIYLCGSDLESRSGEASKNLSQITSAFLNENANVVIQTGGTKKWHIPFISSNSTDRYLIENHSLKLVDRITTPKNFGDPNTLTEFIQYGKKEYPAKNTGLILWDHGAGSLKGICFDENFSFDGLTLPELNTALTNSNLDKKLDFIGLDACLMASFETAYTLAPFANTMIASTEKEPNGGWNYEPIIENLGKENFYDVLLSSYEEKSSKKNYYTLSLIDLTKLDIVSSAVERLINTIDKKTPREIISSIYNAEAYGNKESNLFDLGNLFHFYGIDFDLSDVIKYVSGSLHASGSGMSIYFPLSSYTHLEEYVKNNPFTPYNDFLNELYQNATSETIQFLTYAEEYESKLRFTLNDSSLNYIGTVEYALFYNGDTDEDDISDSLIVLGTDNDYSIENNHITIEFTGKWVKFQDNWLYCTILDEIENYTIYTSPIIVNDTDANLLFYYDTKTKDIDILGIVYDEEYGRIFDLEDNSTIRVIQKKMQETGYEEFSLEEFTYHSNENQLIVSDLPDGFYQYTAFVIDTYGKKYTAGTAVIKIENGEVSIVTTTSNEIIYPE